MTAAAPLVEGSAGRLLRAAPSMELRHFDDSRDRLLVRGVNGRPAWWLSPDFPIAIEATPRARTSILEPPRVSLRALVAQGWPDSMWAAMERLADWADGATAVFGALWGPIENEESDALKVAILAVGPVG